MSLYDRARLALQVFTMPEAKVSQTFPLFQKIAPGQPRWTPVNYEAFAKEGYAKCWAVFRCVHEIAKGAAFIPWKLMDGEDEVEDKEHPLIKLLRRPNPWQGGATFFEAHVAYFLMTGNAYMEGVGPDNPLAPPLELYTHRPDRIKVIPHPNFASSPGIYRYELQGERKDWVMDPLDGSGPIQHWKTFNPRDDWYGQSFLEAAAYSADQLNSAAEWNQSLLQNGAAPSGGFKYAPANSIGATLTREQRAQLIKDMEERVTGPKNARRPLILDGGLEWQEMGLSPKEMDWLEGKNSSARDVCGAFGVPSQILGIPGSQTHANYEEARCSLFQDTVIPVHDKLTDELNNWLVPRFGDKLRLVPDHNELPALAPVREKTWTRVGAADWLTTNEKRKATGYDEIDDPMADQLLVEASKIPMGTTDVTGKDPAGEPQLDADGNPVPVPPGAGAPALPGAAAGDAPPALPVEGSGNAAPRDQVQAAGLNGAQISELTAILSGVSDGSLSPDAAEIALLLAFPTFDPEKVAEMIAAAVAFEPVVPPPPPGMNGDPANPPDPNAPPKPPGKPKPAFGAPKKQLFDDLTRDGFSKEAAAELVKLAYGD